MNFREWLGIAESEARPKVSQGVNYGADARYGGPRTMLPISWGMDNRAVSAAIGGIGQARARIRAQMGAEPGSVSQISDLEDIRRSSLKAIYMPLQVPWGFDKEKDSAQNFGRALVRLAKQISSDPVNDEAIYNVEHSEDNGVQARIRHAQLERFKSNGDEGMKARLYTFHKSGFSRDNEYEQAVNFTTALMQASLSSQNMFGKYSHLMNIDGAHLKDRKMIPIAMKEGESSDDEGEDPQFYMVMMCSFEVSPKDKNAHIGGSVWDEIDDMRSQRSKAAEAEKPAPGPDPAPDPTVPSTK